jgi:hypothetical protein
MLRYFAQSSPASRQFRILSIAPPAWIFAAIRRAPSRINTVGPVLARFFGVLPVTAVDVKTVYLSRRERWTHHRGGCRG